MQGSQNACANVNNSVDKAALYAQYGGCGVENRPFAAVQNVAIAHAYRNKGGYSACIAPLFAFYYTTHILNMQVFA